MRAVVVDASVVIPLYFGEELSEQAAQLFRQDGDLLAPDLIWCETANAIWKRHRRGQISQPDACEVTRKILNLPLSIHESEDLVSDALKVAMQYDRTTYGSLYVALAIRTDSTMVTADKRLVNALADSPLKKYVRWLGDLKL